MRLRLLVALIAVFAALLLVAGSAAAQPLALHPRFQPVPPGVGELSVSLRGISGRYVLFSRYDGLTVVDEETGKRTPVVNNCDYEAFGPPWILFGCSVTTPNPNYSWGLRLYNVVTHKQTPLPPCTGAGCAELGTLPEGYQVGARWILASNGSFGDCGEGHYYCGPLRHTYINIRTGRLRYFDSQLSSTRIMDLDAPYATREVCRPVSGAFVGPVTFYGRFATAYTRSPGSGKVTPYLERCGSNLQMPIGWPVSGNARAIVWEVLDASGAWHGRLEGVLLPSLRRFSFFLPSTIPTCGIYGCSAAGIAVSSRRMFVTDVNKRVWAAPFPPVAPPRRKR